MLSKSTAKYIQSLQHKKFRDETGCFVAEGPKLVSELLNEKIFPCASVFATKKWVTENPGLSGSYSVEVIEAFELEKISALTTPNQVVAIFKKSILNEHPDLTNKITLVLDDIQDPGNLGTMIRIADWFGIKNIYCSPHTADQYNPKVVQSTMASLGRVNILYTALPAFLQKTTIKKYATTLHGEPLQKTGALREGLIVIGNESQGISNEVVQLCDAQLSIERIGNAESLNAAVATGIILYQLLHA